MPLGTHCFLCPEILLGFLYLLTPSTHPLRTDSKPAAVKWPLIPTVRVKQDLCDAHSMWSTSVLRTSYIAFIHLSLPLAWEPQKTRGYYCSLLFALFFLLPLCLLSWPPGSSIVSDTTNTCWLKNEWLEWIGFHESLQLSVFFTCLVLIKVNSLPGLPYQLFWFQFSVISSSWHKTDCAVFAEVFLFRLEWKVWGSQLLCPAQTIHFLKAWTTLSSSENAVYSVSVVFVEQPFL